MENSNNNFRNGILTTTALLAVGGLALKNCSSVAETVLPQNMAGGGIGSPISDDYLPKQRNFFHRVVEHVEAAKEGLDREEFLQRDFARQVGECIERSAAAIDMDVVCDVREQEHSGDYSVSEASCISYDQDGFPVPNEIDSPAAAKAGNFQKDGLKTKFMDNFLRKPESWPVGPVDLRWDRERAVWTVPEYRDLEVKLEEDVPCNGDAIATTNH